MSLDANNNTEEKLKLRNQQNQCKVRLFKKLAKMSSAEMLSRFESNAQALFKVVASALMDEQMSSNKLREATLKRLLVKLGSKEEIVNPPGKLADKHDLQKFLHKTVWNSLLSKRLTRPSMTCQKFQEKSQARILTWKQEFGRLSKDDTERKRRYWNKISALRARMKDKRGLDESFVEGYARSVKELAKQLAYALSENQHQRLRQFILAQLPSALTHKKPKGKPKKAAMGFNYFVTKIESFVWSL